MNTPIEVVEVKDVIVHPNADNLEIVKILNTQFIANKGNFVKGDSCIYFPPEVMIPEDISSSLGVTNYLKEGIIEGKKCNCRVSAVRLRGIASFGFGVVNHNNDAIGTDLTTYYRAEKWQPPEHLINDKKLLRQPEAFHRYTDISHYYRYPNVFGNNIFVRVTEKIHGTNSRVGLIKDNSWEFMVGTHNHRVGNTDSFYYKPLTQSMKDMLSRISLDYHSANVIVFGEIFGNKIQNMDYGVTNSHRVFDISVNGDYLDWVDINHYCNAFNIQTVPLLYIGTFDSEIIESLVSGPTTILGDNDIKSPFKGREGIVITPLQETYSPIVGGRLILKYVNPDYHIYQNRKQ